MRRSAIPFALLGFLAGCGGNDNALAGTGAGLYNAPARDAREREAIVSNAAKELAKPVAAKVAESTASLGFRLIQQSSEKGNVVVSPISVATALSMTANGANGLTQAEMLDALGYAKTAPAQVNEAHRSIRALLGNIDPSIQLRIANSIWARQGVAFKPEFMSVNEQSYGAKTTTLEFGDPEAKNVINRWVKEATEGKIESMVEKLSRDDVMVLLNAVYFKGSWKAPFNKDLTKTGTFKAAEGKVYDVPMMNQRSRVGYTEGKDWKAISMPYGNGKIEMVVVLPRGDLDALVKGLAEGSHKALGDMKETPVVIALPKFQVNYEETLNDTLKKLGMKLAFGGGADFSNLSEEKLFISEVKHKTFLEVDEVGSEAAAATSVTITRTSAPIDEKSFVVDRPFAFMIREKQTGLVLFAGAIRSIGQPRP